MVALFLQRCKGAHESAHFLTVKASGGLQGSEADTQKRAESGLLPRAGASEARITTSCVGVVVENGYVWMEAEEGRRR